MMSIRPEGPGAKVSPRRRDLILLPAAWVVLGATIVFLAKQNLSVPGLYYDEAVFAGLAKDFITGQVHGQHMPDHQVISLAGRPFPLFIQTYLGALKSWMLMPALSSFGPSVVVLRATNLFWQLVALLFLMLGIRRWLGMGTAVIAGVLLAFDPTYFFLSVLDWGVAVPSFVCRCACFYFAIRWNQLRKLRDAFFVGLFAGLGFFNKADFAVFLITVSLAAVFCYWRQLVAAIRQHSSAVAVACLGFALGAGPMLIRIPRMLTLTISGPHPNAPGEMTTKLKTMLSMYDGSHFYRLMNVGGLFERMYEGSSGPKAAIGIAVIVACVAFCVLVYRRKIARARAVTFLIVTALLVTLGVFLLPDAVRIHHAVLVYPLPHLIIAAVIVVLWQIKTQSRNVRYVIRAVIVLAVIELLWSELHGVVYTHRSIRQTGGRGRWSESFDKFCRENRNRSDLTIVSLDWGFNEQLMFLTDGPQLSEPFWEFNQTLPPLPANPNYIYLAHPAEYSVLKYDVAYLNQLQKSGGNAEITPYFDRQNEVAFYTIRFRPQ
ncbi:MAG: glycosyltransferase family 39 protein [Verrucomicrobiota bacterium]|nr:glycosyltransferase family 39 protein [Verrucomicrobiota bacterium]